MRERKRLGVVSVVLAILLLCLSGCNQTGQKLASDKGANKNSSTNEEKAVFLRYDYSDKVLEHSQVEGKFAVYFLASDVHYSSYSY